MLGIRICRKCLQDLGILRTASFKVVSLLLYCSNGGEYLKHGSYYIRERSQSWATRLQMWVEKNGGKITGTGCKILTRKEVAVQGVEVSGGKKIPARVVVSNANAPDRHKDASGRQSTGRLFRGKIKGYSLVKHVNIQLPGLDWNKDLRGITKAYRSNAHIPQAIPTRVQACVNGDIEKMSFSSKCLRQSFRRIFKAGWQHYVLY